MKHECEGTVVMAICRVPGALSFPRSMPSLLLLLHSYFKALVSSYVNLYGYYLLFCYDLPTIKENQFLHSRISLALEQSSRNRAARWIVQ